MFRSLIFFVFLFSFFLSNANGEQKTNDLLHLALGAAGVNIMDFCKQFNARTQDKPGKVLPVVISVYKDKSFDFVIKTPPAAVQLLEAAKVKKGSGEPNINKVSKVTWDQVKVIAEDKMVDLNAFTVESAMKMVAGTARSMGINVSGGKAPE